MDPVITYPTANGATVTVSISYLRPAPSWVWDCNGCDGIRGFNSEPTALGTAAAHAAKCGGQPPTIVDQSVPGHEQLRDLIDQARPGITPELARLHGRRFLAELAVAEGMTLGAWHDWARTVEGRALVVHLDDNGQPHRPVATALFATPAEAKQALADNPDATVVADWSTP